MTSTPTLTRPRIGISACMLGQDVRFDGGHKRNPWVNDRLAQMVDFVPICPEVESGLPTPRESMRLVRTAGVGTALIGNRTGEDYTDRLRRWSEKRVEQIAMMDLDGYLLMKNSPSCGLERVKVYQAGVNAAPATNAVGVFTELLKNRLPTLPLAEGGWMCDSALRESFLEQIFVRMRMRTTLLTNPTVGKLVAFHTDHKLQILARSPKIYRKLGPVVATASTRPLEHVIAEYCKLVHQALTERATPGKQANVLQHAMGYFKESLSPEEKQELLASIDDYRQGLHGIQVPLTLIGHHIRRHRASGWLSRQHYFQPFPKGLHRTALNVARF
ncbi:MAG: hypothetical protein ACI9OJ_004599 [Myxococcota bacterium]|jgi:uncharacterized protein YbgA (DUF1722 family)/uncharacterized protein YbbK (DUF523 family)